MSCKRRAVCYFPFCTNSHLCGSCPSGSSTSNNVESSELTRTSVHLWFFFWAFG